MLIHVGDVVTKGPHDDSMALLTYLASNNVTGVRGNNDQQVVEWRGWLDWITSLPGGKAWLDRLEKISPISVTDESKLIEWMKDQRNAASKDDKKWWKLIPHKWLLFSDHYKVAKDMSAAEFQYLLDLPLRLYVPSAHVFIVHAGLLASDPQYPYHNRRQPLARVPKLMATDTDTSKPNKSKHEVESLRKLQDLSLLTLIPQNLNPWVVLNIRSVNLKNGKVSKKNGKGTPWSDLWNLEMNRCVGYNLELRHDAVDGGSEEITGRKDLKQALPCYPSTVIYGHAAKRGLDLKRWSIGLDSGCVSTFFQVLNSSEYSPFDRFMEENYLRWLLAVLKTSLNEMLKVDLIMTTKRSRIMMKRLRMMMVSILVPLNRVPLFCFPTALERGLRESNVNDLDHRYRDFKPSHRNYQIQLYTLQATILLSSLLVIILHVYLLHLIFNFS